MTGIAAYITGENIAATITMTRAAQVTKRPIVLTEGDKDRRVLKSALRDVAEVIPGYGKPQTIDCIAYLNTAEVSKWLIIVVDADFDRLTGVVHNDMVFMTDCHDLDCEHLRSYALVKVIQEICSRKHCLSAFQCDLDTSPESVAECIRQALLQATRPLGLLRYISAKDMLNLNFKHLDYKKLLQADTLDIDIDKLLTAVFSNSTNLPSNISGVKPQLIQLLGETHDNWQVCQGHDLENLFTHAVRKLWGIGRVTVEEIERSMRLAYESEFFWSTNLGVSLKTHLEKLLAA